MKKAKVVRKTKKLVGAVRILCDEGFTDTSEDAWFESMKMGKFKAEDVFKVMAAYGMGWDVSRGCWFTRARYRPFVRKIFSAVRGVDFRLMKGSV